MTITHWVVREWMNAVTLAVFLCLTWRFWRSRQSAPTPRRREAATALCVLCFGECIRSSWAWLALASQNKGWAIFPVVQSSYVAGAAATLVILLGAVCCLRVSSGAHRSGLFALGLAALFLTITIVI